MVITLADVYEKSNDSFSAMHLYRAGRIVEQLLSGTMNHEDYISSRDRLAIETKNPNLMKIFMDCHPLRQLRNTRKITVSL